MTAVLTDMMTPGPFGPSPAGFTAMTRAWRVPPLGVRLVREEDVYALAADVMILRAARGLDVTVTPENTVWLMRGAVVMLGAFGIGGREEDADAFVVDVALTSPRPEGRGFSHETQPAEDTADD